MGRPQQDYSEEQRQEVRKAYRISKDAREQKRLLCLKLRIERSYPSVEIAAITEYSESRVRRIISNYNREGLSGLLRGSFGGNRRNLSHEAEEALLAPFMAMAEKGQILIVSDIHRAYESTLGRSVPNSTIYRMLNRHNWRKVMPRPRHPKAKPEEQEAYKKNQGKDQS
jgi:transposase